MRLRAPASHTMQRRLRPGTTHHRRPWRRWVVRRRGHQGEQLPSSSTRSQPGTDHQGPAWRRSARQGFDGARPAAGAPVCGGREGAEPLARARRQLSPDHHRRGVGSAGCLPPELPPAWASRSRVGCWLDRAADGPRTPQGQANRSRRCPNPRSGLRKRRLTSREPLLLAAPSASKLLEIICR